MADSWYTLDCAFCRGWARFRGDWRSGTINGTLLKSQLSSCTFAGTFAVSAGSYINYSSEAGTKWTWLVFCTSPAKRLDHWSSHFEPKIALIYFSRDSGQQFPCAKFLKIWGLRENVGCRLCKFGWCGSYYSIRNSIMSLLEGLFARILFRIEIPVRCHFCILFFCARPLSLNETFFSPLRTRLLCASLAIHPVHYSCRCACVCVPLYVCVKMCE